MKLGLKHSNCLSNAWSKCPNWLNKEKKGSEENGLAGRKWFGWLRDFDWKENICKKVMPRSMNIKGKVLNQFLRER